MLRFMHLYRSTALSTMAVASSVGGASHTDAAPLDRKPAFSVGAPRIDAGTPIEIGRSYELRSRILGDVRKLAVYLPPHYGDERRTFPVVYLLDGGASEDFHHITAIAAISAAYGMTQEVIIIGIEGRDRRHDLTSPSSNPLDRKSMPTAGGAEAYRHFLLSEVKPWAEGRFRTSGRSALMGESLAGLFVVETALTAPTSFDDFVAVSPSLWWSNGDLSRGAAAALARHDFRGRRIWLAIADEPTYYPEMKDGLDRLVAALRTTRVNAPAWSLTSMPTETHATIYHPAAMAAFRAIFAIASVKQ